MFEKGYVFRRLTKKKRRKFGGVSLQKTKTKTDDTERMRKKITNMDNKLTITLDERVNIEMYTGKQSILLFQD